MILWFFDIVVLCFYDFVNLWFWFCDFVILWFCDSVILWFCDLVILWCCCFVIVWFCVLLILWSCDFVILWVCDFVILWFDLWFCVFAIICFCDFVISWFCDFVILLFYVFVMLWICEVDFVTLGTASALRALWRSSKRVALSKIESRFSCGNWPAISRQEVHNKSGIRKRNRSDEIVIFGASSLLLKWWNTKVRFVHLRTWTWCASIPAN